jgi:phospholipase/lecithinase/hemolysin
VVPGFTDEGVDFAGLATLLTTQYNQALNQMLGGWEGTVNIIPLDTFTLLTTVVSEVVSNPPAFGFTNATDACYSGFVVPSPSDDGTECQNPDEYVFWDKEHPTTALHAVLAEAVLATLVPDMLDYLTLQVSEVDSDKVRNGLNKKLGGASQKLAQGKDADAVSKLEDFIEAVEAKQGKKIQEDDALSMIMRAEKIIALLEAE